MRIAIVGLGFMGGVHLRAWRKLAADVVAVSRSGASQARGNLPGEPPDWSGIPIVRDIDTVLDDPSLDAVDLCLPTPLHEEFTIRSLRAGKHVMVEKPMAPA